MDCEVLWLSSIWAVGLIADWPPKTIRSSSSLNRFGEILVCQAFNWLSPRGSISATTTTTTFSLSFRSSLIFLAQWLLGTAEEKTVSRRSFRFFSGLSEIRREYLIHEDGGLTTGHSGGRRWVSTMPAGSSMIAWSSLDPFQSGFQFGVFDREFFVIICEVLQTACEKLSFTILCFLQTDDPPLALLQWNTHTIPITTHYPGFREFSNAKFSSDKILVCLACNLFSSSSTCLTIPSRSSFKAFPRSSSWSSAIPRCWSLLLHLLWRTL